MTLFGIDVSRWQATLDWSKVTGEAFMFARASINTMKDTTYDRQIAGATKDDLQIGAYHFLYAGNGAAQCDAFLAAIGGDPAGLLCAVDCESGGGAITYTEVAAFHARFHEKAGDHPLFTYCGKSFGTNLFAGHPMLGPLWLAYYPGGGYPGDLDPTWRYAIGGEKPTIWQYGPAHVAGQSVDGDAYRGDLAHLQAYAAGSGSGPNVPGGDMSYGVDHYPYPDGPRLWHVAAGVTIKAWDPAKPGTPVKTATFAAASAAHASGTAAIKQMPDPTVVPHGSPFLLVTDGTFAGLYIAAALVTVDPGPPPPPCFTQADLDAAKAAGIAAGSKTGAINQNSTDLVAATTAIKAAAPK